MPANGYDPRLAELAERSGMELGDLMTKADYIAKWALRARMTVPQLMRALFRDGRRWRGGGALSPLDDNRHAFWRVRLRLIGPSGDVTDDTDPECQPQEPGADMVQGLRGVMTWAADTLQQNRPELYSEALREKITDRIPSLRVSLARNNNGYAVFKIPFDRPGVAMARVDVFRQDTAKGIETRSALRRAKELGEANGGS